jgi:acyl-CoA synthetase (NDP forming)
MFESVIKILFEDPEVSGIILLGLHHTPAVQEEYIPKVANFACLCDKPIVACDIGETEMAIRTRSTFDRTGIPSYSSPEDAARAMDALVRYGSYLQKNRALEGYMDTFQQNRKKNYVTK